MEWFLLMWIPLWMLWMWLIVFKWPKDEKKRINKRKQEGEEDERRRGMY